MKIKPVLLILFCVSGLVSVNCSNNKQDHDQGDHGHATTDEKAIPVSSPQFTVDEKFQDQLAAVFTSYVSLKEALVASDPGKVQEEAAETAEAVSSVDMTLVSGAAHNDWMNYQQRLKASLDEMAATDDLEAQRAAFSTTSDNLYKSIKAFGLGGDEAFYEYCPMAFNNQGGYWLSDNKEIRNPYFGDEMLKCGEVKERLK